MDPIHSLTKHVRSLSIGAVVAALALSGCAATECCGHDGATKVASTASRPAQQGEFQLPDGWTQEDMEACMIAGTPNEMHEYLAQAVGEWTGTTRMWMPGGNEPMTSETEMRVTSIMDGRYIQAEYSGEMPGMGDFRGIGISGYDVAAERFVSSWIDNHSTKIMVGEGKRSADGKVMTWSYTYVCPVKKAPAVMREVETISGRDARRLEMFGTDPKSGREYKMMEIEFRRKGNS
jgi:hypothetical protein